MKLFLDTADSKAIQKYLDWGVVDGVTTNPSIMLKCGAATQQDMRDRALWIANAIGINRPLSVEVVTDDLSEMVTQARDLATIAPNIAIKIPVTTTRGESCLPVVCTLAEAGIDVNVTAMLTFTQFVLAAKAGGRYLSLFGGRIDDEGGSAETVIADCAEWLMRNYNPDCEQEIIAGSVRTVKNVRDWVLAGADIVTVSPDILEKMLVNARTKETVEQFLKDGTTALEAQGA